MPDRLLDLRFQEQGRVIFDRPPYLQSGKPQNGGAQKAFCYLDGTIFYFSDGVAHGGEVRSVPLFGSRNRIQSCRGHHLGCRCCSRLATFKEF